MYSLHHPARGSNVQTSGLRLGTHWDSHPHTHPPFLTPFLQQVTLHFFNEEVRQLRAESGGKTATDSFFDLDEVMAEGLGTEPDLGDFLIELQLWKVRGSR